MKNKIRQKTLIYRPHYNLGYVLITFSPDSQTEVYGQRLVFLSWMSNGLRAQVLLKYMLCIACIMIPRKLYRITRYTIKSQNFNENTFPVRIKDLLTKSYSVSYSAKTHISVIHWRTVIFHKFGQIHPFCSSSRFLLIK